MYEKEIEEAQKDLAAQGYYVEVTSAVNYAGYLKYCKNKKETIVIPLCGSGLKSL